MEKMREDFEAWWVSRPHRKQPEKFQNGDYMAPAVLSAWEAWQASRAALVVELPQVVGFEGAYDSHRDNEFSNYPDELMDCDEVFALSRLIEVREAIEAAGVKVKA